MSRANYENGIKAEAEAEATVAAATTTAVPGAVGGAAAGMTGTSPAAVAPGATGGATPAAAEQNPPPDVGQQSGDEEAPTNNQVIWDSHAQKSANNDSSKQDLRGYADLANMSDAAAKTFIDGIVTKSQNYDTAKIAITQLTAMNDEAKTLLATASDIEKARYEHLKKQIDAAMQIALGDQVTQRAGLPFMHEVERIHNATTRRVNEAWSRALMVTAALGTVALLAWMATGAIERIFS